MKAIKKFLAVLLAAAMCFTLVAFAACSNDSGKTDDNNGGTKNEGEGNGNGTVATVLTVDQLLSALTAQSADYFSVTVNYEDTEYDGNDTSTVGGVLEGKVNLAEGSFDITLNNDKGYGYAYMRGWDLYTAEVENVPDGSTAADVADPELEYLGNGLEAVKEMLTENGLGAIVDFITTEMISTVAGYGLDYSTYLFALYADLTGSLTIEADKATIDVNNMIYTVVSDVSAAIDEITVETTVEELLRNETLKKYLSVVTDLIPLDIVKTVPYLLSSLTVEDLGLPEDIAALFEDVSFSVLETFTSSATTTYDYLVDLICSDQLNTIMNAALPGIIEIIDGYVSGEETPEVNVTEDGSAVAYAEEEDVAETQIPKFSEITVGDIIMLSGVEESDVEDAFDGFVTSLKDGVSQITATELKYTEIGSATGTETDVAISGLKVVFTLSGSEVTGINVAMQAAVTGEEGAIRDMSVNIAIGYSAQSFTLEDISSRIVSSED